MIMQTELEKLRLRLFRLRHYDCGPRHASNKMRLKG